MRRAVLPVVALLLVASVVAIAVLAQRPTTAQTPSRPIELKTDTVTRGPLTEELRIQGTLSYSSARDLGTALTGVVTGLTPRGTVVTVGGELFRVDDAPVVLMRGTLPVWRAFGRDMADGADVLQLEKSLALLGFFDLEPDEEFTAVTEAAVKQWQESIGLETTGTIEVGRIVFATSDLRIQAAKVEVGGASGPAVVTVTGASKRIVAFLDVGKQASAPIGKRVTIELPDGSLTKGTVVSAGTPVEREGSNGTSLKIPVTIRLAKPKAAADFDGVPVTILLVNKLGKNLLRVPVVALLAQPGGEFAVELATRPGSTEDTTLVPVELGAFADGLVAVTGGELREGDIVVVAK